MNTQNRHPLLRLALAGGALCIAGVATASAEDIWVSRPRVLVFSEPSPGGDLVGEAHKGAQLHVVSHGGPKNAWLQVSFVDEKGATKQGWVSEKSTSVSKVDAATGGVGSANASALSVGAAGRGLEPQAEKYIDAKHLNKKPVQDMIDATNAARKELATFMTSGHVGAGGS